MADAALSVTLDALPTLGAFVSDDITKRGLQQALIDRNWTPLHLGDGGIDEAIDTLAKGECPNVLIVDLTGSPDPRADMQALAEVCEAGTLVTALGTWNDVSLYRDLLQAGVQDYLMKPAAADALGQSLDQALALLQEPADQTPTSAPVDVAKQQVLVTSVRGGLGCSTLAANLAWHFAKTGLETALLDMDLVFGTAALQFDLEPGRGLADALENPARVDGLFLERAVVKPAENLSILGSEAPPNSLRSIADGAEEQLLGTVKDNFSHVVIDLPRQQLDRHPLLLSNASDLVLMADLSLVSARDTIRLLAHARQVAPHLDVHLVGSMIGLGEKEVDVKDFENSVERSFAAMIPFDARSYMAAAQSSKVVVEAAPSSKAATAIKSIAAAINKDDPADKQQGWFARLLGK